MTPAGPAGVLQTLGNTSSNIHSFLFDCCVSITEYFNQWQCLSLQWDGLSESQLAAVEQCYSSPLWQLCHSASRRQQVCETGSWMWFYPRENRKTSALSFHYGSLTQSLLFVWSDSFCSFRDKLQLHHTGKHWLWNIVFFCNIKCQIKKLDLFSR